jgi:putative methionine-R-sulfoxide reductase with GAF domain
MSKTALLDSIHEVLNGSADADAALREVVELLAAQPGVEHVAIAFAEEGRFVVGPHVGVADATRRTVAPVVYQDAVVGELRVDGDVEPDVVDRVAHLIAAHVLLGWDTGGEAWNP